MAKFVFRMRPASASSLTPISSLSSELSPS
jgi:hypothetical protein